MPTAATASLREELLAAIQSEEEFLPRTPHTIEETGLPTALVESLVCKYLSVVGSSSGRGIAKEIGLPLGILENVFHSLRCPPDPDLFRLGPAERPYLRPDRGRPAADPIARQRLRLRRPRAGAPGRLRRLGPRPDDPRRGPPPRPAGAGLCRYLDRSGSV